MRKTLFLLMLTLLGPLQALAASPVPPVVNIQGVVKAKGVPFTGTGSFKFALLNSAGEAVWSNDGLLPIPDRPVSLPVEQGAFSVALGSRALEMPYVTPTILRSVAKARVWFSADGREFEQLTPDTNLSSAPFALLAAQAIAADSATSASSLNGKTAADFASSPFKAQCVSGLDTSFTTEVILDATASASPVSFVGPATFGVTVVANRTTGKDGQLIIQNRPGIPRNGDVTFRRKLTSDRTWAGWSSDMAQGRITRHTAILRLLRNGAVVTRWVWADCLLKRYSLRPGDDGLPVEEIVLAPTSWARNQYVSAPASLPTLPPAAGFTSGLGTGSWSVAVGTATNLHCAVASSVGQTTEVVLDSTTNPDGSLTVIPVPGATSPDILVLRENGTAETVLMDKLAQVVAGNVSTARAPVALTLSSSAGPLTMTYAYAWPYQCTLSLGDDGLPIEDIALVSDVVTPS